MCRNGMIVHMWDVLRAVKRLILAAKNENRGQSVFGENECRQNTFTKSPLLQEVAFCKKDTCTSGLRPAVCEERRIAVR